MPKNKRNIAREEKLRRLMDAARRCFLEDGYEGTSMSQIAKTAGITPNTIYWYFKNKDELFAATIKEVLKETIDGFSIQSDATLPELMHHFSGEWMRYRPWALTLHQRSSQSPVLRETHDIFHKIIEEFIYTLFVNAGANPKRAKAAIRFGRYTIEGMLMHGEDDFDAEEIFPILLRAIHSILHDESVGK